MAGSKRSLQSYLDTIPDPREMRTRKHGVVGHPDADDFGGAQRGGVVRGGASVRGRAAGLVELMLGQEAVAAKSNEITAIPDLLATLHLKGTLVTIDAAGTQAAIARQIVEQGGDYLLPVKGNQPTLRAACEANFATAQADGLEGDDISLHGSAETDHGRIDERYTLALANPKGMPAEWSSAKMVVQVNREREVNGKRVVTTLYDICSRRLAARTLAQPIRRHWAIENELHWVLDVVFREDENRTRDKNAGANLGLVRRVALTLLKRMPGKDSLKTKRMQAAWNPTFRLKVLHGLSAN